jgi:hypothetical protein
VFSTIRVHISCGPLFRREMSETTNNTKLLCREFGSSQVADRSWAWVYSHTLTAVASLNPAGGTMCCVLCCTVKDKSKSQDNQGKQVRTKYRQRTKKIPAGVLNVSLLRILSVVRYRYPRRADLSSRGILPTTACLTECD